MTQSTYRIISALRMRQFELLCVLAETANMRQAAERLHLSTAAVSKSLGEIEHQLGMTLFVRHARGLVPTAAGSTLVHRARALLSEVALLADDLRDEREGRHEVLRIGAPPFVAWTMLPGVLSEMRKDDAGHSLQIIEGRLADMQQRLINHEIDVLLTMNTPSELGQLDSERIVIQPICDEHWLVVCRPGHPALAELDVSQPVWPQLRKQDWILPPRPTQSRMMFEQCLLDHGLAPIAPAIESTNAITNLNLARAGHGLTLMAQRTVQANLDDGSLVRIDAPGLPAIPIVLAHKIDTLRRETVQRFYEAALRRLTRK
ncbi:LysR family transcriptional regulator [Paracandidimonas soli]|uniref:DNA-binding transcriptional LysR family regulator n=2 Tax=Paracandidimonas soli TaxID=1917182 RepID=A0A4V2VR67_9BURK|nr:LysR family transcriptional regulator [Paracandidimonas soli]TCU97179.1 DNA-binding transcriptional LysR family regulator [Paracandidimonas soli]